MRKQENTNCVSKDITPEIAIRAARKVTWMGFWVNALLGVIKVLGGIFGRSEALLADGIHSFSDFASDIIVLTMVPIARKNPDRGHQFGHGRYEALATILLATILVIVGIGIFYDGATRVIAFYHGEQIPRPELITLIIIVASIVSKEWLFVITKKVGIRIHSDAVIANAWHHRSDSFSSLATLAGVTGAMFLGEDFRILDPIAAMVVAIFIVGVGVKMYKPSLSELLGASLSDHDLKSIEEVLNNVDGINSWHALRTFKSGNDAYIEVHLKVNPELSVRDAHNIASMAERKLRNHITDMSAHVITHIEPDESVIQTQ